MRMEEEKGSRGENKKDWSMGRVMRWRMTWARSWCSGMR